MFCRISSNHRQCCSRAVVELLYLLKRVTGDEVEKARACVLKYTVPTRRRNARNPMLSSRAVSASVPGVVSVPLEINSVY